MGIAWRDLARSVIVDQEAGYDSAMLSVACDSLIEAGVMPHLLVADPSSRGDAASPNGATREELLAAAYDWAWWQTGLITCPHCGHQHHREECCFFTSEPNSGNSIESFRDRMLFNLVHHSDLKLRMPLLGATTRMRFLSQDSEYCCADDLSKKIMYVWGRSMSSSDKRIYQYLKSEVHQYLKSVIGVPIRIFDGIVWSSVIDPPLPSRLYVEVLPNGEERIRFAASSSQ